MAIKKDTLHPEGEPEIDIYPKTSIDQVENLQANLDALNGDIANANGEIANISTNVETIANRVEIAENSITVLTTAYESYTDYTEVTNGFLLTYLSGRQIELPIKAGTNVTFSKYPGTNQIVINATGGSVPDNIALLDANNTFSGSNTFNKFTYFNKQIALDINPISFNDDTKNMSLVFNYNGFIKRFVDTGNVYSINIPNKTGTIALTTDIPTLADYPTTIFFNNYNAGIGYKDTSTGTIKTVVSTDNNGAQIVLGDNNTGLTLATNARPKVLEDSTVKEVAYVSDIPNTSSFATLAGNNKWTGDNIFDGFSKSIRVNGLFQVSGDEELISATYNQVSYDGFNIAYMDGENQNIFHIGIDFKNKARFGFDKYDGSSYNLYIPEKDGTIALLSDIPSLGNFTFSGNNMNIRGSTVISRSTGSPTEFIFGNYDNQFRSASNGLFTFYNQNAYAVINLSGKTGPQILAFKSDIPNTSTPQYNRGIDSATPTTFTYELGVYHTLTITLLTTYVSTTIILPNDYDGSRIDIELEGKSFLIMVVAGLLSVRNTTDNTEWVGKLE